jgi:hypothetical protein
MTIPVGSIVSLKQGAYFGSLSHIVSESNGLYKLRLLHLNTTIWAYEVEITVFATRYPDAQGI